MRFQLLVVSSLAILLVLSVAPPATADSAVLGFTSYSTAQPAGVNSSTFFAQAFTIGTTLTLGDISLLGITDASCPCSARFDLASQLGASATSSIATFSFNPSSGPTVEFPLALTLTAGEYFLVLSTGSGSFDWDQGSAPISSSIGGVNSMEAATVVNSTFPPASNFSFSEFDPRAFQLVQTSEVPEPSTLLLLGTALLGLFGKRKTLG